MTEEKWQALLKRIKMEFENIEEGKDDFHDDDLPFGYVEWVVFQNKLGRFRLERTITPRVLEKKTIYSHRGGSETVQKIYSDTEMVAELDAYRWDDDKQIWEQFRADSFM